MSLNSESRVCWHFVHSFQRTTWYNTKHSVSSGLKTATDGHPLTDRFTAYTLSYRLHHQEESEFWRRLRSASSHELSIPRNRLSTYGDRAFPVAAVRIWKSSAAHHICSVIFCLLLSLAWRHTSSNSVTRNYCCRAREVTLSFLDTSIALTYTTENWRQ